MIPKMRKTVWAPESADMCWWPPCRQVAMVRGSGCLVLVHGTSLRPGVVPGTCMAAQMTEGLPWLQELPPLGMQRKMYGVSWRSSGQEALLGSGWETVWPGDVSCVLQNTGHRRCGEQHPHGRLSSESLGPGGPAARGLRREVISQRSWVGVARASLSSLDSLALWLLCFLHPQISGLPAKVNQAGHLGRSYL